MTNLRAELNALRFHRRAGVSENVIAPRQSVFAKTVQEKIAQSVIIEWQLMARSGHSAKRRCRLSARTSQAGYVTISQASAPQPSRVTTATIYSALMPAALMIGHRTAWVGERDRWFSDRFSDRV